MRYNKTTLQRLADRGVLQNDINYRKRVYAVQRGDSDFVLIRVCNSKYRVLLERNINAMQICESNNINAPRLIDYDACNMELLITNVGDSIFDIENKQLNNIASFRSGLMELNKLNEINKVSGRLTHLPYYDKACSILSPSHMELSMLKFYKSTVDSLGVVTLGYGTDDPSPTNFCSKDGIVSIIDFDNFFADINIWVSYGFAISNLFIKTNKYDSTLKSALKFLHSLNICNEMTVTENRLFRIGLLNNLLILHYDDFIKSTFSSRRWVNLEQSIII